MYKSCKIWRSGFFIKKKIDFKIFYAVCFKIHNILYYFDKLYTDVSINVVIKIGLTLSITLFTTILMFY